MTPPIVLLHGFTQTGRSWEPVRGMLGRAGRAVIAPDLRGHGTARDVRPVTLEAVFGDLDAIVDGAVLGGYSMGGRIALAYAQARPERVRRLVLVGASPGLGGEEQRRARREADERLAARIEADGVETFAREWAALPLWRSQPAAVAEAAHRERLRQSPAGLAAALRGLGTGVLEPRWEALGRMRMPVVLVVGELDDKFRAIAAEMAERLPRGKVVVVPGAGHAVALEAPGAVAAQLLG